MENYFKTQGTLVSPYYLGLRGFLPAPGPYANFTWQDGTNYHPPDVPSDEAEQLFGAWGDYTHWGGNGSYQDPSFNFVNGNCVVAEDDFWRGGINSYHYYKGVNTTASRGTMSNYVVSTNSTQNLWSWRRVRLRMRGCCKQLSGHQT